MIKRGQAWGVDLMIASLIFSLAIFSFFLYSLNYSVDGQETFEVLQSEGRTIADSLLSEGSPANWDSSNVVRIGIAEDGRIDQAKLEEFYDMAQSDYERTKTLFRVRGDYFVNLSSGMEILGSPVAGIGEANLNADNLVRVNRVVFYDSKPTTLVIYVTE